MPNWFTWITASIGDLWNIVTLRSGQPVTSEPAGGAPDSSKPPWYIGPLLIVGLIILVIIVSRGMLKKAKLID